MKTNGFTTHKRRSWVSRVGPDFYEAGAGRASKNRYFVSNKILNHFYLVSLCVCFGVPLQEFRSRRARFSCHYDFCIHNDKKKCCKKIKLNKQAGKIIYFFQLSEIHTTLKLMHLFPHKKWKPKPKKLTFAKRFFFATKQKIACLLKAVDCVVHCFMFIVFWSSSFFDYQ